MELEVENNLKIDNIEFDCITTVEISHGDVRFGRPYFYTIGKCKVKDIKTMIIDDNQIIKNGKVLIDCTNCENCPRCFEVECSVQLNPHTYQVQTVYYCDYRGVYADKKQDLKKSKTQNKWRIELKRAYDLITEEFKYRRENYITEKSIEKCIEDIKYCLTPSNPMEAIDEYGYERIELEEIRLGRNDYGYDVYHHGRMGDYGWTSTVYLHEKCNMDKLYNALKQLNVKIEIEQGI